MREIKFRAYHKKLKEMFIVKGIDFLVITNGTNEISNLHLVKIDVPDKYGIHCRLDEVELLQFTGLKDKNGKEVYEGYIIKTSCECGDRVAEVKWDKYDAGFEPFGDFVICLSQHCNGKIDRKEIKVIGSIYENPELLK